MLKSHKAKLAALYKAAIPFTPLPSSINGATLRQWEWGLPIQTIQAYRDTWAQLGKPESTLTVLQGGMVSGYIATAAIWEKYLLANGLQPRGITVYSYWIATPSLDRLDFTLPVPAYAFWKPDFHPVFDQAQIEVR